MKLERDGIVVEIDSEPVISAFKEAGYIESTPKKVEPPVKEALPKKATTTKKTNTK